MPPKSQDSTILNAIRLARTQPVTFGRGLIRTDDNSVLGYVSDLNNMEVDRNGNVRRRKGTVAMNSGKLNDKWYFLESYQIAGVPILFGLSYKRELWAWIDTWPEVDIKVCDKNTYGRFPHYSANSTDPVFNTWVSFSRGSSFHVLKTDRHITIVNNLNDAIRIYSKGCFALAAYKEDVTQIFAKEDIEAVRDNEELELAMYLSIKDVTNKIIEPAIVVKTDDRNPIIEGDVQFASINEEGTAGRFTYLQKIEQGSPFFSIYNSIYSNKGVFDFKNTGKLKASGGVQSVDSCAIRTNYNGSTEISEYELIKTEWTPNSPVSNYNMSRVIATIIVEQNGPVGDRRAWLIMPENKYLEYPTKFCFFEVEQTWMFNPENQNEVKPFGKYTGSKILSLTGDFVSDFGLDFTKIGSVVTIEEDNDYNWIVDQNIPTSRRYMIDIEKSDFLKNINTGYGKITFNDDVVDEWVKTSPQSRSFALIAAFIEFYSNPNDVNEYRLNEVALKYDLSVFNNDYVVFEHKNFNTWNVFDRGSGLSQNDVSDIDSKLNMQINKYQDLECVVMDNSGNKSIQFLSEGFSWCVKNNDTIVAKNQFGFLNKNKDNILYETEYANSINNNELPFELMPCYLPVVSLSGSSLFRYIDQDKNREVFYDVQYAFNVDDKLLVIQDGAIWVGDTNTLKLTYDKAIQGAVLCADKFYGGLLIGTTDGLYFYNQGQLTNVIDGQAIIAKGIRSGVNGALVIDEYGRPQYITVQINEGGIYGRLLDISQPVSDIVFDGINMIFVDGVFYVAQDDKVFGLTVYREEGGLLAVWGRVYVWEGQKISLIANHNNRLIVAFETGAVKSEVFEQPWDPGIK